MSDLNYISRDIEAILKKYAQQFPAIVLTGPRQAGKSTLLMKLFGQTHKYITFDDPLIREAALSDPRLFMDNLGDYAIIDEVQYVPEILSYIKMAIDQKREQYGRFIITGSQQFQLIKNLGDSLAGRVAMFYLLPFNTNEKKRVPDLQVIFETTEAKFSHACLRGSYPEIVMHSEKEASIWYGSYFQTYLERDVRALSNLGNLRNFQQFVRLLAARCSQILNQSSFAKELGVSVSTIKNWLSILEASQVIFLLPPFYRNLGKRVTKSPKVYFLDTGFVCYLTGLKTGEHLFNGPMAGALFENFVIQETVKSFYNQGQRPDIYYLRTQNQMEVDLIVEKNLEVYPYEIKFTKSPRPGMASQIERFRSTFSELTIHEGRIISLTNEKTKLTRNVSLVGLEEFLVELI